MAETTKPASKKEGRDKEKPPAKKPEKAEKPEKSAEAEVAAAESAPKKAAKTPPRPPADLRLKVLKKLQGRFLPRGPLRDRSKALFERWNSGDDHGGVTLDELKCLLADWRSAYEKPPKASR
jgi:hypothetical protein